MIPFHPTDPAAPPAALPDRLQEYARFVALVAEQLAALRCHDFARVHELDEERASLEAALDQGDGLLREGLQELDARIHRQRQEREHWSHLHGDTLRVARDLRPRSPRRGEYRETPASDTQVDLRF